MTKKKPNCIIVGVQKAGTTALKYYMNQHPDIYMCKDEIHYFDEKYSLGDRWYLQHFQGRTEAIVGEKSPGYLYFWHIPKKIYELNPDCKLIVCLREPVARAYSEYQMLKLNGSEKRKWEDAAFDFNKSYLNRGMYATQLENLFKYFDKNQVLIIKTEDLYNDREATLKKVFRFLEVDDEYPIPHLGDRHKGGHGKYKLLTWITGVLAESRFKHKRKRFIYCWILTKLIRYFKYANKKDGYEPMSITMEHKLKRWFQPFNDRLEKLTGINWEY